MAPEAIITGIGAVLTGLTGLVVAWSGLRKTRNLQLREDLDTCWTEQQHTHTRFLAALAHLSRLEELLAGHGLPVPMRPENLEPGHTAVLMTGGRHRLVAG